MQYFWVVHDKIQGFHQQAIINAGKFVLHDTEIEAVGLVAVKAAEGVAAIAVYLGFSGLLDFSTGPVDVSGINTRLDVHEYNINNLSTKSTLSINKLNTITASILGYINGSTAFSKL